MCCLGNFEGFLANCFVLLMNYLSSSAPAGFWFLESSFYLYFKFSAIAQGFKSMELCCLFIWTTPEECLNPCFWFGRNLCLQVTDLNVLLLVWGSYRSLRMVVLELFTFYFCSLAWWLSAAIDTMEPLYSETSAEALHLYVLCSLCSLDHLHGNRGAVTWHVPLNIAQHCSRSTERNLPFHLKFTVKSISPFQIHYKVGLLWLWASEKPMLMTLHRLLHPNLACLFSKLSFIFNLCFLSCCIFFSVILYCRIGIFTPGRWWGCLCTQ